MHAGNEQVRLLLRSTNLPQALARELNNSTFLANVGTLDPRRVLLFFYREAELIPTMGSDPHPSVVPTAGCGTDCIRRHCQNKNAHDVQG